MTPIEQTQRMQQHINEGAKQYEADTGFPFRTALKQCHGRLSHVIMPADLWRRSARPH